MKVTRLLPFTEPVFVEDHQDYLAVEEEKDCPVAVPGEIDPFSNKREVVYKIRGTGKQALPTWWVRHLGTSHELKYYTIEDREVEEHIDHISRDLDIAYDELERISTMNLRGRIRFLFTRRL